MKKCRICEKEKNFEDFYPRKDSSDGYRTDCKECVKARRADYRKNNYDKIVKYNQKYAERYPERVKEYSKRSRERFGDRYNQQSLEWYYENQENRIVYSRNYRAENKESLRKSSKLWRENNKDLVILYSQKRRALKIAKDDNSITYEGCIKILKQQNYKCVYCTEELTDKNKTIDHIIPLSKGGMHFINNIQYVCGVCNSKKNTKTHEEYLTIIRR